MLFKHTQIAGLSLLLVCRARRALSLAHGAWPMANGDDLARRSRRSGGLKEWVFARLERHLLIVSDLFWRFFFFFFSVARHAERIKNRRQISETKRKYTYAKINKLKKPKVTETKSCPLNWVSGRRFRFQRSLTFSTPFSFEYNSYIHISACSLSFECSMWKESKILVPLQLRAGATYGPSWILWISFLAKFKNPQRVSLSLSAVAQAQTLMLGAFWVSEPRETFRAKQRRLLTSPSSLTWGCELKIQTFIIAVH